MRRLLYVALFCFALAPAAEAQLQLPGASGTTPAGSAASPFAVQKPRKTVTPAVPRGEESLPGRFLRYMGQSGTLSFTRSGTAGKYAFAMKLDAVGRRGNDIRNACSHDFTPNGPIALVSAGRPHGLPRYEADVGGCTVAFEFLADAAVGFMPNGACLVSADCAIDVSGLWGADSGELPKEPEIERARTHAENRMNTMRKLLQQRYKNTPALRSFISEQVSFPANRERQCRSYGGESGPGYCALKLTEARASQLEASAAGGKAGP